MGQGERTISKLAEQILDSRTIYSVEADFPSDNRWQELNELIEGIAERY